MSYVVVREHARLTVENVPTTLDRATVSASAFEWLCSLSAGFSKTGANLVQLENRRWLKLDNYVGIIQTPCGTTIEILPKHSEERTETAAAQSRALLIKMLQAVLNLPVRATEEADIHVFRNPLLEWVMQQFLNRLEHLLKRGLRFDYLRVEDEQKYIRGQLNIPKQVRSPPGRAHIFHIRHDLFLPDRAENRLLMSALERICKCTKDSDNWRLSHELKCRLAEIKPSRNTNDDFAKWRSDRLMAHYQPIRPWCELVLSRFMPLAVKGTATGISMLFPMEKLFERYVGAILKRRICHPFSLNAQSSERSLCIHRGRDLFNLRPDFVIQANNQNAAVLDTKWKRISSNAADRKYDISQSDAYQMFAYGDKYLSAQGNLLLIYPKTLEFQAPLSVFAFSPTLSMWVVPFDLERDELLLPLELPGTLGMRNRLAS